MLRVSEKGSGMCERDEDDWWGVRGRDSNPKRPFMSLERGGTAVHNFVPISQQEDIMDCFGLLLVEISVLIGNRSTNYPPTGVLNHWHPRFVYIIIPSRHQVQRTFPI